MAAHADVNAAWRVALSCRRVASQQALLHERVQGRGAAESPSCQRVALSMLADSHEPTADCASFASLLRADAIEKIAKCSATALCNSPCLRRSPSALSASSAGARRRRCPTSSPRGDTVAPIDITHFQATNGKRRVSMRVEVADLKKQGSFQFSYVSPKLYYDGAVIKVRWKKGKFRARWAHRTEDRDYAKACPGMKVSWSLRMNSSACRLPRSVYATNPVPASWNFGAFSWSGSDADYDVPELRVSRG